MAGFFDDDPYTVSMDNVDIPAYSGPGGEIMVVGDSNSLPTVSTDMQTSDQAGWGGIGNILGSIGSVTQTARDLGTAVGAAKRDIAGAGPAFKNAEHAAESGNKVATWWQYASTTDKLMVGLAVIGIGIAIYGVAK